MPPPITGDRLSYMKQHSLPAYIEKTLGNVVEEKPHDPLYHMGFHLLQMASKEEMPGLDRLVDFLKHSVAMVQGMTQKYTVDESQTVLLQELVSEAHKLHRCAEGFFNRACGIIAKQVWAEVQKLQQSPPGLPADVPKPVECSMPEDERLALYERESHRMHFLEQKPYYITVYDPYAFRVVYGNEKFRTLWKSDRLDTLQKHTFGKNGIRRHRHRAQLASLLQGSNNTNTMPAYGSSGTRVVCNHAYPYFMDNGRPVIFSIGFFIGDHDGDQWRLRVAFDDMMSMVTVYDSNGKVVLLNNRALAMLPARHLRSFKTAMFVSDAPFETPIGTLTMDNFLTHAVDKPLVQTVLGRVLRGERVEERMEVEVAPKGVPERRWHLVSIHRSEDPNSKEVSRHLIIVNETDISAQVHLEHEVHDKMSELHSQHELLHQEQTKSNTLMSQLFPKSIVSRLNTLGQNELIADYHEDVTLIFADIVGFTAWSAVTKVHHVVRTLNTLISAIDDLTLRFGIEKIKTIGDCYFGVCGCPEPVPGHTRKVVAFAVELLRTVQRLNENNCFGEDTQLQMRVGIHCGEVIAGIIGKHKLVFDLWGDAVNMASRMESTGVPGKIQLSAVARDKLGDVKEYQFMPRSVKVKGKGTLQTYLMALPDPSSDPTE